VFSSKPFYCVVNETRKFIIVFTRTINQTTRQSNLAHLRIFCMFRIAQIQQLNITLDATFVTVYLVLYCTFTSRFCEIVWLS
jgi:hypothetical protein